MKEKKTYAAETEYRSVFENMPSAVAYHKVLLGKNNEPVDHVFLKVNKAFEKLVGLKDEHIIGKKVTEVLPWIKSSIFDWINFYGTVASSGRAMRFEQYVKNADQWYAVSAYSPSQGYFITIYSDITKRKKAEESLRKAYDELKKTQTQLIQTEKMEVVGRLASGVAHEVKNPIAILQQGIDYLLKKIQKPEEDINVILNSMNEAINKANYIMKDLLDFSRISKMQLNKENINTIIENSLVLIENDIRRNNIRIIKDFDSNISKTELDKNRIEQVFVNLFMNSIEAMPEGGQLKISTHEKRINQKRKVIIEITDTGGGIQEEILDKIFDPFFTTKEVGKGTGLGLSIVINIIKLHDGQIKIENRKGRRGVRAVLGFKV